jgi:hypothetical protein
MSICANYRRLSLEEFERLRADPDQANVYFGLDIDEDDDEKVDAYYDRLEANNRYLDIGKTWHGLHFLLTGEAKMDSTDVPHPMGSIVLGGTPTEWEATYGVVRYLMPREVQEVAHALDQISESELRQRYDPYGFQVANIYPGGEVWNADGIEELLEVFSQVRDFFSEAARDGDVVLLSSD